MRLTQQSDGACYLRRLIGGGPRFLGRHAWPEGRSAHRAQVARSAVAHEQVTASSWRGLLMVPGGAPMPPECFTAMKPAGAAPRPATTTPRENAPSVAEVEI